VVTNEEEALNFLFEGEQKKTFAATQMNEHSSRAHSVYTIYVQSKGKQQSSEKVIQSKLHLVDLAGNERTKKLEAAARMKEANYINKSLSFLEQVVVSACDSKKDHVPYRQSKLTNMLKSSIGGNCRTVMIANIWPEEQNLEETISTLKFAARMMKVQNEAVVNELQDPSLLLKKYQREVRELKQELQMHDTLASRGRVQYDPYTPEQQYEIQKVAEAFLKGEQEEVEEINSMRQVKELLAQMRNSYMKLVQDGKNILDAEQYLTNPGTASDGDAMQR
jgi:kinesin family member 6/9